MINNKRTDSAMQRYTPKDFTHLAVASASGEGTLEAAFRISVPDNRLRVKVTIFFQPAAGATPVADLGTTSAATLWLYEAEMDNSGVSGKTVPCADIEGTSTAPTPIPESAGLYGYSREFTTLADYIEGAFTTESEGTQAGTWILQVTYCPDSVRFTPQEWDAITQHCAIERTSGPVQSN